MKFKTQAADVDFIDTAPLQFINTVELNATPQQVFDSLANADHWLQWFPNMSSVEWRGTKGVGVKRFVKVGAMAIDEHFIRWDKGVRMAFYISATSMPFAKKMVEDYRIEATEKGSRFTYAVGLQLRTPLQVLTPVFNASFSKMFKEAVQSFQDFTNKKA